jgi:integrase
VPQITLSDAKLRSLPLPPKGQCSYWDASFKAGSFACRVSSGGAKTFIVKHRNRRFTIGSYPTLSLSEARTEARKLLAEFTLGKTSPQAISYKKAVESFIEEKRKARRESTADAYEGLLNRLSFQDQIAAISFQEVERKLKRIKTHGAYNHHLVALKVFFNWCIKRRYRSDNPTLGLSKFARPKKKRILTDEELVKIWNVTFQIETDFGEIVRLLILLGQRRAEIAGLQDAYYSDNTQILVLPPEATKNGHSHALPLGPMAADIISKRIRTERPSGLLFEGGKTGNPFSAWSKNKKALDKLAPIAPWTLHDLRRTLRTGLGRLGVRPDIAERVLNHVSSRTEVEDVYDLNLYLPELREAMQKWEDHLTNLLAGALCGVAA